MKFEAVEEAQADGVGGEGADHRGLRGRFDRLFGRQRAAPPPL